MSAECECVIDTFWQVSLDDVDGVFTVSGDGLLNECVNGLMGRNDAVTVLKRVKVGTVPGGTGNALAAEVGGMHPIRAALAIIKGTYCNATN